MVAEDMVWRLQKNTAAKFLEPKPKTCTTLGRRITIPYRFCIRMDRERDMCIRGFAKFGVPSAVSLQKHYRIWGSVLGLSYSGKLPYR